MRERARDKGRLIDIMDYSANAMKLIEGFTYEAFIDDIRTYYAVMKNVEVVGEATYMLTKAFKAKHSTIPWEQIQGLRHILVHGYAQIRPKILYNTAINDLPNFRDQVACLLDETDWDAWEQNQDTNI